VVSITILKGGDAYNVIPESASLGGTFRSMTDEGLAYLMKRIREVNMSHCKLRKYGNNSTVQLKSIHL
jgi:IAA-amino acid hydrolase